MRFALGALCAALLLATAGCGTSAIQKADDTCVTVPAVTYADSGHSVIVSGAKKAGDFAAVSCVLKTLGASQALVSDMDSTNALMGRQSADENGYHYEWSYHPDNGLDMTITEN